MCCAFECAASLTLIGVPLHLRPDAVSELLLILRDPSRASVAASSPDWWEQIKLQADRHHLSGFLARVCGGHLPPDQEPWRRNVEVTHLANHHQRLRVLKTVVSALNGQGIAALR